MIIESSKGVSTAGEFLVLADEAPREKAGEIGLEAFNVPATSHVVDALQTLETIVRECSLKDEPDRAASRIWTACLSILQSLADPEVCIKALHTLRSVSQTCGKCARHEPLLWQKLPVRSLVEVLRACLNHYPQNLRLQEAGCALLARLSGCSACQKSNSRELNTLLRSSGALTVLADALRRVDTVPPVSQQAAAVVAIEALAGSHHITLCSGNPLGALEELGGLQLIINAGVFGGSRPSTVEEHLFPLLCMTISVPKTPQQFIQDVVEAILVSLEQERDLSDAASAATAVASAAPPIFGHGTLESKDKNVFAHRAISALTERLNSSEIKDTDAVIPFFKGIATILTHWRVSCTDQILKVAACVVSATKDLNRIVAAERVLWLALRVTDVSSLAGSVRDACVDAAAFGLGSILESLTSTSISSPRDSRAQAGGGVVHALASLAVLSQCALGPSQTQLILTLACSSLRGYDPSGDVVEATALDVAVRATVAMMNMESSAGVNSPDADGCTLLHRFAAAGQAHALSSLLDAAGSTIDLLARTRHGETALQLARAGRHTACSALLEDVTQRAAETRQEALLRELESEEIRDGTLRKARKKKSVAHSPSFNAGQPGEKSQKMAEGILDDGDDSHLVPVSDADVVIHNHDSKLRQQYEEEYERALEARRLELELEKAVQAKAADVFFDEKTKVSSMDQGIHGSERDWVSSGLGFAQRVPGPGGPEVTQRPDALVEANSFQKTSLFGDTHSPDVVGGTLQGLDSDNVVEHQHSLFGTPSIADDLVALRNALLTSASAHSSSNMTSVSAFAAQTPNRLPDALFLSMGPTMERSPRSVHPMSSTLSPQIVPQMTGRGAANGMATLAFDAESLAVVPPSPTPSGGGSDSSGEEPTGPTRHLWIGNLGTRTPRAVLKSAFERYGSVEDVVTFPGRMYAFVNFETTHEAMVATNALQGKIVPDISGDRQLLLKYRPAKKAAAHMRAFAMGLENAGTPVNSGSARDLTEMDRDGNCAEPSPRIWLGNIAPTATTKTLQSVLSRFGTLTDAAVFPARIGPLGYAFVKFESVQDAVRAFEALNNTVVPILSGSKQLKMRYKPATAGPAGRDDSEDASRPTTAPSRHLWLGNVTQKPSEEIVFQIFSQFGKVDSVRVFPAKAYAFVNFGDMASAVRAMTEMEGACIPALTGVKPLVMRFQQETQQHAVRPGLVPRTASESALALAASLQHWIPGPMGSMSVSGGDSSSDEGLGLGAVPGAAVGFHSDAWAGSGNGVVNDNRIHNLQRSQSVSFIGNSVMPFGSGSRSTVETNVPVTLSAAPMTSSASATHLSAVLNNLAALQRAASSTESLDVQTQLLQRPHLTPAVNNNVAPNLAHLSSLMGVQSLAPAPATVGWGGSPTIPTVSYAANETSSSVDALICPLSRKLMTDPVVASDGVTYNRPAITEWLTLQSVSPMTQAPMLHASLIPNLPVRNAVVAYLQSQLRVA